MILRSISLEGWRCFINPLHVGPFSDGLNVLYAPNATGKSTLFEALLRGMIDSHRVTGQEVEALRPWGRALAPAVIVEFTHRGTDYRLAKRFLDRPSSILERRENGRFVRLAEYLNVLHPELQGRYAEVITSGVADADDLIRRFKREDYPQVAVSVGMLDTGFDCREVLHLVMCRRVRSPILYQQMRGRGTRTAPHIRKQEFVIYDFFGNHQYFNDSDTDIFTGSGGGHATPGTRAGAHEPRDLTELGLEDEWLQAVTYVEVGPGGERVDKRDYVTNWERTIQQAVNDSVIIRKVRDDEPLSDEEEKDLTRRLNQPEMYFNEDNLRRAYRQPGGTLIDFIRAALGRFKLKSREEELTENFQAWLVAKNLSPEQAQYLTFLKNRGVVRGKLDLGDLFQPPLSVLNAAGLGVELFGEKGLKEVIADLNTSVFQKQSA